jgi:hypothetical protein
MSDAELGRNMARLSPAERLARAVLLFHKAGPWRARDNEIWLALTGQDAATTRVLCDLARSVRSAEERK